MELKRYNEFINESNSVDKIMLMLRTAEAVRFLWEHGRSTDAKVTDGKLIDVVINVKEKKEKPKGFMNKVKQAFTIDDASVSTIEFTFDCKLDNNKKVRIRTALNSRSKNSEKFDYVISTTDGKDDTINGKMSTDDSKGFIKSLMKSKWGNELKAKFENIEDMLSAESFTW